MAIKLSIIVPVYNVAAYLGKCLTSLVNQDIDRSIVEIIVINDGSTDNSLDIATEYEKKWNNIQVVSQKNGGLGAARNTGIRLAKGEYLLFVDSDDYLTHNCLGTLLEKLVSDNLDILRFNYQSIDENYEPIAKSKAASFTVNMSEEIVDGKTFLANYLGWSCYVYLFIFRKSLLGEGSLYFVDNLYFEDVEWLPRLLIRASRISSIDLSVYNYLRRSGSITKNVSASHKEKLIHDKLVVIKSLMELKKEVNDNQVDKWVDGLISLTVIKVLSYCVTISQDTYRSVIFELLKLKIFPLKTWKFTRGQKLKVFFINTSPNLFVLFKRKTKVLKLIGIY